MTNFELELAFHLIIIVFSLLAVFVTFWIVWHVEKKLDVSFKFFLGAIMFFTLHSIFDMLQFFELFPAWHWEKILKAGTLAFFALAIFEMREVIVGIERRFTGKK